MKKTRTEKIGALRGSTDNGREIDILTIIGALHTSHTGSSDPLDEKEEAWMLTVLQNRLENWQPGPNRTERFDDAVRVLIMETLTERGIPAFLDGLGKGR